MNSTDETSETYQLAARFLTVMESLGKLAGPRMPDKLVGQLHLNQLITMHILQHQPGIAQKVIADKLEITRSAVSTGVRELESLGLVERRADPDDARSMCLFLSAKGEKHIAEAQNKRRALFALLLSALPLDEQYGVVEALERALAAHRDDLLDCGRF